MLKIKNQHKNKDTVLNFNFDHTSIIHCNIKSNIAILVLYWTQNIDKANNELTSCILGSFEIWI